MHATSDKRLIVIGAGPKAMALAAKSAVLAELGLPAPEIHLIEREEVGANWTGKSGFTNGRLPLGTPPEKDVGFPYQSTGYGPSLDAKIDRRMRDFSWASYLVSLGEYSDWVDRGRPAPEHQQWASYLKWVGRETAHRTVCRRGEAVRLRLSGDRWEVGYLEPGSTLKTVEGDGLVVTGPGLTPFPGNLPNHDSILTVETFWRSYERFRHTTGPLRLALVGSGENAAAIAMALFQLGNDCLAVDIVSPKGMTFTRGESFRENRVYSDAGNGQWEKLTPEDRRQFIQRTDRGVFSQYAQKVLDQARIVNIVPGRLMAVKPGVGKALVTTVQYVSDAEEREYDFVVLATGADQVGFLRRMMDETTEAAILRRAEIGRFTAESLEPAIDKALGLRGLVPRLHLPMLSGMAQGPGFANLSCLGRLSDRILAPYLASSASVAA